MGNAGVLLTRVEYVKPGAARNFLVVDAAMNDLIRPALYGAWHDVEPVRERNPRRATLFTTLSARCARAPTFSPRSAASRPREGDLLAMMSAGAYGMSMSSNYNSRPRAAEVLVDRCDGASWCAAANRSSELFAHDRIPA